MSTPVRTIQLAELPEAVGELLGPSEPVLITQEHINKFADATGDHQWIHVDPERAKAGPFGGPIAHGYLTISLGPGLLWTMLEVPDAAQVINYGLGKVRFPSPLPVDSEVTLTATIASVDEIRGGFQVGLEGVFEVPGGQKPVCVGEAIFRYLGDS